MAIHAPITGAPTRAPAIAFHVLPRRVRRLLATVDRDEIGEAIEVLVARLDQLDGDPDLEETDAEDSFVLSHLAQMHAAEAGPGCPIADCDKGVDDDGEAVNEDGAGDITPTLPRYGVDQSLGPINEREGYLAWQRGQMR